MPKDFFIEQLKQRFIGQSYITRDELLDFYRFFEPDLKETTFGWRIYALKEKSLLKPVKQGVYTLSVKPQFHPVLEPKLKELSHKISKQFPAARHCIWNTRWLNEWMIHQPGRFLILVELEAMAVESAFNFLRDENYKNVFLNPDDNLLERYIYEETETIIVKTLVTKAPIKKEKKIFIPILEKILVDLFVDKKLFAPFQGSELVHIYNNTYRLYSLNMTKLLAYAKRRTKEQELLDFITKQTQLTELLSE
ncbi:MAG TPA: DUF6577 family protein [Chitinophagaceae bacterium]|nr:DUF6577 family protein [Chitinophagaceae bacterium]